MVHGVNNPYQTKLANDDNPSYMIPYPWLLEGGQYSYWFRHHLQQQKVIIFSVWFPFWLRLLVQELMAFKKMGSRVSGRKGTVRPYYHNLVASDKCSPVHTVRKFNHMTSRRPSVAPLESPFKINYKYTHGYSWLTYRGMSTTHLPRGRRANLLYNLWEGRGGEGENF